MTPLRQRMLEDLRVRNYSKHTIAAYIRYIARLARHFNRSPADMSSEDLRAFLVHLREVDKVSSHTLCQFSYAMRFLYKITLKRDVTFDDELPRVRQAKKLPRVLSREDAMKVIGAVENLKHRTILWTLYATGVRVSEVVNLKVGDIDSKRMMIIVREGKGLKDRYVPLSPKLLVLLRDYWRACRPPEWLFPSERSEGKSPLTTRSVIRICEKAGKAAGIKRRVSPHVFRHSYATHLLEAGVNIRVIQRLLGHGALSSTAVYTHVSMADIVSPLSPLDVPMTSIPT